jgi:4'-phosphopantetheinyl transferase
LVAGWPIRRLGAPAGGWLDCAVWRVDLDLVDPARIPPLALCAFEQARATRFRFDRDAARYRAAHWGLRLALAAELRLDARQIRLRADADGKPHVDSDGRAGFNLSHSAGVAVVAVCADGDDVGVDVECRRPLEDVDALAARHLTAAERRHWQALPAADRGPAFLLAWTRKEAALKSIGKGLSVEPARVEAGLGDGPSHWPVAAALGGGVVDIRSGFDGELIIALARHRAVPAALPSALPSAAPSP